MRRHRLSKGKSKRVFRKGAAQVHKMNGLSSGSYFVMRGGIRL